MTAGYRAVRHLVRGVFLLALIVGIAFLLGYAPAWLWLVLIAGIAAGVAYWVHWLDN